MKKSRWLAGVLAIVFAFVGNVSALSVLPESDYWSGWRTYTNDGFDVRLEYDVYDMADTQNGWTAEGYSNPGDGQYVFAYWLWNQPTSTQDVAKFQLLNSDSSAINSALISGFGSVEHEYSGVAPDDTDSSTATWSFNLGSLTSGTNSYLLVFSSNTGPIAGTYSIDTEASDGGQDPPIVPEPATLAIISAGAIWVLKKRKSSK